MSDKNLTVAKETAIGAPRAPRAPSGFEGIDFSELPIPRLRLLQDVSKAVKARLGVPGQFENSITKEIFDGPLELVPIRVNMGAVYIETGEGLKCKSADGRVNMNGQACAQCPFNEYWRQFKPDGKPPKCAGTVDFLMIDRKTLTEQVPSIMMLTFSKTSYKIGKEALAAARFSGRDLYARAMSVSSWSDHRKKGDFKSFEVKPAGLLSPEELKVAAHWASWFSGAPVNIDEAHDDVAPGAAAHPVDDF